MPEKHLPSITQIKTIINEDLTCDPEDREKSRRCWLSLTGTHYSMNIADKFDVMYNKPVTDRVVNLEQQLLKRISSHVNGLQDSCYALWEKTVFECSVLK